jgi:hypothetical protein
MEQTIQKLQV